MALRIEIDGKWDVADFAAFFRSIDGLYQFLQFDRYGVFDGFAGLERSRRDGYRLEAVQVSAISYASPGFTDLLGIAGVLKEVREFVQFIIERYGDRDDRRLDRELKKIEIAKAKVELLETLHSRPSFSPGERELFESLFGIRGAHMPDIDPLIEAVMDGRVVGAKSIDLARHEVD